MKIARFNSFGNGFGKIKSVDNQRNDLLKEQNIMEFYFQYKKKKIYEKLACESLIWVNYQPSCAEKIVKGGGKMINGIRF